VSVRRTRGNIVLIGFMGSGKSSVARLVASKLGHRFVDTDRLVTNAVGSTIKEIFEQQGENFFRDREAEALRSLQGRSNIVLATGGGIVTRRENIPLLQKLGFVVWLKTSAGVIFERVSRTRKRPLLMTENPRETIAILLAQRTPLYGETAHHTIDTSALSHEEVAEMIISEADRHFSCENSG
jgi:shikimate kinase